MNIQMQRTRCGERGRSFHTSYICMSWNRAVLPTRPSLGFLWRPLTIESTSSPSPLQGDWGCAESQVVTAQKIMCVLQRAHLGNRHLKMFLFGRILLLKTLFPLPLKNPEIEFLTTLQRFQELVHMELVCQKLADAPSFD